MASFFARQQLYKLKSIYNLLKTLDKSLLFVISLYPVIVLFHLTFLDIFYVFKSFLDFTIFASQHYILEFFLLVLNCTFGAVFVHTIIGDHRVFEKSELSDEERICLKQRIFSKFIIYFILFIVTWSIMHALVQLEYVDPKRFNDSNYWLFMLFLISGLSFAGIVIIYTLDILSESVNKSLHNFESDIFKLAEKIKDSYLKSEIIVKFILISIVVLLVVLLASSWVHNSHTPRLKTPPCELGDIICSQENSPDITQSSDSKAIRLEAETNILRNKWIWIFAFIGIALTIWGRIISHQQTKQTQAQINFASEELNFTGQKIKLDQQSNIAKIIQEALKNIYHDSMGMRLAGFQILMQIEKDSEATEFILRILLSFMDYPYITDKQRKIIEGEEYLENSSFMKIFDPEKQLPKDIQEAANSISIIYNNYYNNYDNGKNKKLSDKIIELPEYFWKNKKKAPLKFPGINLQNQNLEEASLIKANLSRANLEHVVLSNAKLFKANLPSVKLKEADLVEVDLQEADLSGASLEGANLSEANLQKADLPGANIKNALLYDAKLQRASLFFADLTNAKLDGAKLQKADLEEVNLERATLSQTDITDANFLRVTGLTKEQIIPAIWGIDEDEQGEAPVFSEEIMQDNDIVMWRKMPDYRWEDGEKVQNEEKMQWRDNLEI